MRESWCDGLTRSRPARLPPPGLFGLDTFFKTPGKLHEGAQGFLNDLQTQCRMQIARNRQSEVPQAGGMTKEMMS